MAELRDVSKMTEKEFEREKAKFLKGLPTFNWGAFFMPPVWGPIHGIWLTILYYPAALFLDDAIYSAFTTQKPMSIVLALIMVMLIAVITAVFAHFSQGIAAKRAFMKGKTQEQFLKEQRIWAIVSFTLFAIVMIAATYYNLCVRPTLGY